MIHRLATAAAAAHLPLPTTTTKLHHLPLTVSPTISLNVLSKSPPRFLTFCCSSAPRKSTEIELGENLDVLGGGESGDGLRVEVGSAVVPAAVAARLSLSDQAFYLFAFVACTTSIAFTSLVIAAIPTLFAMGRAANSLSKLADTAREEIPSTMAAIRLSGMEISDLTLELSDLSHEIAGGVKKSAKAVKAAEAGVRQIGSLARDQTMSMIDERANLPTISLQPVVAGAAKKTSRAVGQATKSILSIIYGGEDSSDIEKSKKVDRLDI